MLNLIRQKAGTKRIVILGFGLEGQSTLKFLLENNITNEIAIADKNPNIIDYHLVKDQNRIEIISGDDYLTQLKAEDFIIKSPGVGLKHHRPELRTWSQTSLFLERYGEQIIGITGTKGKSTTSTMMYRILQDQQKKVVLVGNIGLPAFDFIPQISSDSFIVYELSAHQLQCVSHGPRMAILLNLMPEHLDFFGEVQDYYLAKCQIFRSQTPESFAFTHQNTLKSAPVPIEITNLKSQLVDNEIYLNGKSILSSTQLLHLAGKHHISNIQSLIELILYLKLDLEKALETIKNFQPLPHRQELLGEKHGLKFINDSISTIPQSAIYAVNAFEKIDYLILGGLDRGIDYGSLVDFLATSTFRKVFFLGNAGRRILSELNAKETKPLFDYSWHERLHDIKNELLSLSKGTVLLSPAAASYDAFKNFEERGNYFRQIFSEVK